MIKKEYKVFKEKYMKFMYNKKNLYNCEECPENNNYDSWQNRLPCGQQNCWVAAHCERE